MYWFLVATVTNYHKLGGIKTHTHTHTHTHESYSLRVVVPRRASGPKSRCQWGHTPLRGSRRESVPYLFKSLKFDVIP